MDGIAVGVGQGVLVALLQRAIRVLRWSVAVGAEGVVGEGDQVGNRDRVAAVEVAAAANRDNFGGTGKAVEDIEFHRGQMR